MITPYPLPRGRALRRLQPSRRFGNGLLALISACGIGTSSAQVLQDYSQYIHRYESFEVPGVANPVTDLSAVELTAYLNDEIEVSLTTIETIDEAVETYRVDLVLGEHNDLRPASNQAAGCVITAAGTKCRTETGVLIINAPAFPEDAALLDELEAFISGSSGTVFRSRSSVAPEEGWPYATDTVEIFTEDGTAVEYTLIREPLQVIEYLTDTSYRHTRYRYDRFLERTLPAREELVRHTITRSGLPATRRTTAVFGSYFDPNVGVADFDRLEVVIHPNPAHDELYLQAAAGVDVARVEVHDMLGRRQDNARMVDNRIDISSLPAGNYVVTYVSDGGEVFTTPFTKL